MPVKATPDCVAAVTLKVFVSVLTVAVVFAAMSETYRSAWQCAGGVTISSSVDGSFSLDGDTLVGQERLRYRADSSQELIITFEWNATRR
jgi:hypothetical protein